MLWLGRIFHAALTIHQNGAVVDPVTLAEELERHGVLQAAGGREYVVNVGDEAGYVAALSALVDDAALRKHAGLANQIVATRDYDEAAMIARYAALYGIA